MSSKLEQPKLPKDVLEFFAGVSRLAARARARGELGRDGEPIWSIPEWQAFCKGVRAYKHTRILGIGMAAYATVVEVEACIADGYEASAIHDILLGIRVEKERAAFAARAIGDERRGLRSVA